MKPPAFWARGDAWPALLAPLGAATAALTAARVARPGWQAPVPVFCAGNATLGGAGKTTLALDLLARLRGAGIDAHALSRGHGGTARGVLRVDPARHDAALAGDEPLLLAAVAPCWTAPDRAAAARAAIAAGAQALVMDDGLQNPSLARRGALVIDGPAGIGNGRLFPAGPLREPLAAAAARCQIAVLIGPDATGLAARLPPALPVLACRLRATNAADLAGRDVAGLCGIARPGKFRDTLLGLGARIAAWHPHPDHHRFTRRELDRMLAAAAAARAVPVTTAKDLVRIPPDLRPAFRCIGVALDWDRPGDIDAWLGLP